MYPFRLNRCQFLLAFCLSFYFSSIFAEPEEALSNRLDETPSVVKTPTSSDLSWTGLDLDFQLGWPVFTDKLKFFERLYGKPNNMFTFGVGSFVHTRFGGLGLGGRLSYLKQTGKVASRVTVDHPSDSDITPSSSDETLSLMPYQLVATAHVVPYWRNVSLKGWAGYEEYYYEAVQAVSGAGSSSQMVANTQPYMSKGWGTNFVFGSSVNIQLNWIDEQTANSMNSALNFSRVYLSPFIEFTMDLGLDRTLISQSSTEKASFARQVYGIGFLFESGT